MIGPRDKDAVIISIDSHNADVDLHTFCRKSVPELPYEFVAVPSYETVIVRRINLLHQGYEDIVDAIWNETPRDHC